MMNFERARRIKERRFFASHSMHHVAGDAAHPASYDMGGTFGAYVSDDQFHGFTPFEKHRANRFEFR
jgi:hypothetical protein